MNKKQKAKVLKELDIMHDCIHRAMSSIEEDTLGLVWLIAMHTELSNIIYANRIGTNGDNTTTNR